MPTPTDKELRRHWFGGEPQSGFVAHGGAADGLLARYSADEPQTGREQEYRMVAAALTDFNKTLRAVSTAAEYNETNDVSAVARAERHLAKAKRAIVQAEDDEDHLGQDGDDDCLERAQTALNKATKLLAKADDDEFDDARVDQARATAKRVAKALANARAERATVQTARTAARKSVADSASADAAADKALDAITSSVKVATVNLKSNLAEIMDMIANAAKQSPRPFPPSMLKAETAEPKQTFSSRLEDAKDLGLDTAGVIQARALHSKLELAKAGGGDIEDVKAQIRQAPAVVQNLLRG